jgi:DNA-binding transcriptional ArsR family regulator
MTQHDPGLTPIFQALSDPTRRAMLSRLMQGPAPVTELARPTGMALPTVMRHLAVLQQAGLIDTRKSGRTRLCRARPGTLSVVTHWLDAQRALWEARTDRLESLALALTETDDDPDEPRA